MKIGILIDELLPGGVQKIAVEEVKCLRKLGHDATLLIIWKNRIHLDLAKEIPTKFLADYFPFPFNCAFKFPCFHFLSSYHFTSPWVVAHALKKKEFDILFAHNTLACFTAQAIWKKLEIPYLAYIYDPMTYILEKVYSESFTLILPVLKFVAEKKERSLLRDAKMIVLPSKFHTQLTTELCCEKRIFVVHPGCEPLEETLMGKDNYILLATRWDRGRNTHLIEKILKEVPRCEVIIAGFWSDQKFFREFFEKLNKLGFSSRVEITGKITERKLRELYAKALVYIHTDVEGFGMGALEAAACSTTFIIPDGSGVTELFDDKISAFFVNREDEVIDIVEKLIQKPDIAIKMGNKAYGVAKKRSWMMHVTQIIKLIKEV